jgi:hypothetical protein
MTLHALSAYLPHSQGSETSVATRASTDDDGGRRGRGREVERRTLYRLSDPTGGSVGAVVERSLPGVCHDV